MKKYLWTLLFVIFGCGNQPEPSVYLYFETEIRDKKEKEIAPKEILAINDSIAYDEAYAKYCISRKVYTEIASLGKEAANSAGKPVSFKLLDEMGNDVRSTLAESTILAIESRNEKSFKPDEPSNTNYSPNTTSPSKSNSTFYISRECYGAKSKDALNALVRHLSNNDISSAKRQLSRGELIPLNVGTAVEMINYGFANCKVEIVEGSYSGEVVYVITEFIGKR